MSTWKVFESQITKNGVKKYYQYTKTSISKVHILSCIHVGSTTQTSLPGLLPTLISKFYSQGAHTKGKMWKQNQKSYLAHGMGKIYQIYLIKGQYQSSIKWGEKINEQKLSQRNSNGGPER